LTIHLSFFALSDRLKLDTFAQKTKEEDPNKRRLNLQNIDIRDRIFKRQRPQEVMADTGKSLREAIQRRDKITEIFEENQLITKPKLKLKLTGLGRNLAHPTPSPQDIALQAAAPRPEILSIDASNLKDQALSDERKLTLTPKLDRKNVPQQRIPSLVTADSFQTASNKTLGAGMRLSMPGLKPLAPGEMPQREPIGRLSGTATGFAPHSALPPLPSGNTRSGQQGETIEQLDTLLTVTMNVYQEGDGGGFFRIDIAPNPHSDRLKSISKDILFLIDCSTSISPTKLEHFKTAVLEALNYLNPSDRFNVVSFRDAPEGLFQGYLPANKQNRETAKTYLRQLYRGGMTNVYAGLSPFVQRENNGDGRPLNVFLMTDGQSTVKERLDNATFIRQISALNQADISIYTFSAGKSANRFLLDFLAYTNRGLSLHQANLRDFKDQLVGFISTHSELIVGDLKYRITGGMGESIFPQKLPHLYRGETLSVYGRYPKGTGELAIQIIGKDASGKLEELIYRGNLDHAAKIDSSLALDWASQKIFYLISLKTLDPNADTDPEIKRLARQYKLYVPYL
jgi:Mg-chelatase subunit ChlD